MNEREYELIKKLGENERQYLKTKAEIEAQLDVIRPRNYIGPLYQEPVPMFGSIWNLLFGSTFLGRDRP